MVMPIRSVLLGDWGLTVTGGGGGRIHVRGSHVEAGEISHAVKTLKPASRASVVVFFFLFDSFVGGVLFLRLWPHSQQRKHEDKKRKGDVLGLVRVWLIGPDPSISIGFYVSELYPLKKKRN